MKITVPKILDLKNSRQISMMTAYDFPTANAISEAGIDIILVGDSLAQVVLGHDDTLSITMDEMSLHLMGKEGRKNVIKKFNVEKMCFSTYSEYKRLLN